MKRFVAMFCALGLLGAAPAPAQSDAAYEQIAKSYFDTGFKASPVGATFTGVHTYDKELDDMSASAILGRLSAERALLAQLSALDPTQLSPEVAIDRKMLMNQIQDDLLLQGDLEQWKHKPEDYAQTAIGSIFGLISRNFAPLPQRMQDAIARERKIPALLDQGKANIMSVDATTQRIAAQDIAGGAMFFSQTVPQAFAAVKDPALQAQLRTANAATIAAIGSYVKWVKALKPSGTFAIGADAYQKRLLYEDAVSMPLPEYLAVGERELARLRNVFVTTAKRINPHKSPMAVYEELASDHPAPNQLLPAATQDLVRLRAFLISHHIITLPPDANIKVVETPPFQRATTTASMDSPGPLETVATQAYYNVTPADPKWSKKQADEFLAQFNNYQRPIISAHEVYPGHYVNFVIDKHLPLSLTRKLIWNPSFGEGWAHYSEQMMVDQGWGNGDPRVRLAQTEEALLRAARFVVGVKLHTQGMTVEQATNFFVTQGLQPRQVGVQESLRGTQDPMYGYYTLGKLEILKLRSDYRKKLGGAYTIEKFHDALLAHGDPPVPYLRSLLLGSADDGKAL